MRLRAFRAILGLSGFWAIGALAQTSPPSTATGVIAGVVLDAATNEPLRRAIVTLSTVEAQPQDAVAWSDANGRFSFGYLPPGRYQVRATKDGYQPAAFGAASSTRPPATIQLTAGQVRNDCILHLLLISSITGLIVDEDGDPLPNVQVLALRPDFQRGKRKFVSGPVAMTDSTGHYRLTGLLGGQYAIGANSMFRQVVKIRPEAAVGDLQQNYLYGAQFYPAADRAENATLVEVQPGHEVSSVDFRLQARPAASIEGKIIVPPGVGAVTGVSLNFSWQDLGNRNFSGVGAAPPDYLFVTQPISPGSYVLTAQANIEGRPYRGALSVSLGPQGLRGISIPLEPSVDLMGTVTVEGPDAAKQAASFVALVPGDDIPSRSQPLRANVSKDGSFKIPGVPSGIWDINVGPIPPGGYIKSMRLGDQDVLTEEMTIRPSTTEALNIVLGTRAASIEGDVFDGDQPVHAVVLLAPEVKLAPMIGFYRFATTDEKGHFQIDRARPGASRLFAFADLDQQAIRDPEFLKPFEKFAVPVTLREGPNDPQKLSLIPKPPAQGALR